MTAQYAIHELKQVRQYCSARAIPAIDYAIQVLQGLAGAGAHGGGGEGQRPPGPASDQMAFRIDGIIHHGYKKAGAFVAPGLSVPGERGATAAPLEHQQQAEAGGPQHPSTRAFTRLTPRLTPM